MINSAVQASFAMAVKKALDVIYNQPQASPPGHAWNLRVRKLFYKDLAP